MAKLIFKVAGLMTVFAVLLGGVAQAAPNSTTQHGDAVQPAPTGETRALVVGGLAFVLMVGAAGAVLWHTARSRHSGE
ncbi:MAG TPA: hypothetical protein VFW33_21455 [Gemmataceae bacterium]|nr:hypothetical protein [Gemmataceae bacterium]